MSPGRQGRRADHRGFRRRPAQGADRALAALRRRWRDRPPQGPRRLRLDLRARPRARRARRRRRSTCSRRSSTCSSGHGSTTIETPRRPQAQLRMGAEEPVRAAAQRPLPALQLERARARAARLDQQSRADAQPVPQRGLRVRQRLRVPGAAGRGQILQRRRRVHPGAARPQHVGDQLHPRPRRLRAQALGASAAPAART